MGRTEGLPAGGVGSLPKLLTFIKKTRTCWLWTGAKNSDGYGCVWLKGREARAARAMWEAVHRRDFPKGKIVMHSCDNRACVNPKHLAAGTFRQNSLDMYRRGRRVHHNKIKTHCKRGHGFTSDNTYLLPAQKGQPSKRRGCRVCIKLLARQRTSGAVNR